MDKFTVFILDYDEELIEKIKARIHNSAYFKFIGSATNGDDALRKIKVLGGVDLLITELFIKDIDGYSFIKKIRNSVGYNVRKIICTSEIVNNEIFRSLNSYHIDYFFLKPYDLKSLFFVMKIILKGTSNTIIERYIDSFNQCSINDYYNKKPDKHEKTRIEEKVTILLHDIGIPAHIKGYVYIRCAIIESFYNPSYIGQITKALYPEIARRYSSTPSRVERAIRHAIEIAWNRGSIDLIDKIFGYTINANKAKPTNSEFIAMLTDKLRLELKSDVLI